MGEEGITLKDGVRIPAVGGQSCHIDTANHDSTGSRLLESGNEAKRRRLSTSAWPEEGEEYTPFHPQRYIAYRQGGTENFANAEEFYIVSGRGSPICRFRTHALLLSIM